MTYEKIADFFARSLIGVLFIFASIVNMMQWETIVNSLHQKSVPLATVLVVIMIALQLLGGAALILGFKLRAVSILLMLLLISYLLIFGIYWHPDWTTSLETNQFTQNVGIFAALLFLSCRKG